MPSGPPGIDDDTIRARCASTEAAAYTLYVRRLAGGPELAGGPAEVLRRAAARGVLPARFSRQTLSEHLSGRYRHGPPWETTEMIIECLPADAPRDRIRAEAADLHRRAEAAAAQHRPSAGQPARRRKTAHPSSDKPSSDKPGSDKPGSDNPPDPARTAAHTSSDRPGPDNPTGPDRPPRPDNLPRPDVTGPEPAGSGGSVDRSAVRNRAGLGVRRPNAPGPGRHAATPAGRTPNSAPGADGRPDANQARRQYGSAADRGGPGRDVAVDIADLRADCARLTVQVLLLGEHGSRPDHRTAELFAALQGRQRGPLGQLSRHIVPAAPLPLRALAQYLCAYAELGRCTVTELAVRTGLSVATVAEILAARRPPTEAELHDLATVLGADAGVVRQLAGHARSVRAGTPGAHR
ncbi:helix-turn-helix domain-containing protein [Micromonospora sp. WMMD1102]|uniref:helix-turn-helix domain-containing protein n=1 Tax=Micromonospora sp. WMMD1102 TaxID=3016105 RepID=UPI0024155FEA|nr:helix-turn-helix domain-containing protein [Micromonospora sp. WMMD1102]MDG4785717.1 helix-turn-helix domain-containing protein [Micromonospora sp. WMMD1102]